MIQFADEMKREQVWEMWKTVFGDTDEYMEVYFRHKYRDEYCLLYMEGEVAVASLQMLPYRFTFCGTEIPVTYLSGVATLPAYRKKGYMGQLLVRSFAEAARNGVALMLLVPQDEWLLKFYDRYGFAQTFDRGEQALPSLKELVERYPGDLHAAFREFNALFSRKEMTVQKSFDDFRAMVEEGALFDFPPKRNLLGMARVIDAERLLTLFADRYRQASFSIMVQDEWLEENNGLFTIGGGKVEKKTLAAEAGLPVSRAVSSDNRAVSKDGRAVSSAVEPVPRVDVRELAQLLLGYHTSGKGTPFSSLFPEKEPQMHFMLE